MVVIPFPAGPAGSGRNISAVLSCAAKRKRSVTHLKRLITLLLAASMLLGMVACGGSNNGGSTADGNTAGDKTNTDAVDSTGTGEIQKTLTIGTAQDINTLNPQTQNDQINNNCLTLTHQTLIYLMNPEEQAETGVVYGPSLAETWEWEDENTLVFHLYEGIKFSDGTPCTADDVVYTYEMAKQPDAYTSGNLALVESVEARDELTVVMHCTAYSNDLLSTLSGRPLVIQSKAAWESGMDQPWLIGTGQYVFDHWTEGQEVVFTKNANYWCSDTEGLNAPGVAETIIFKPILEASSRVIALQNGEIDVCIDPPTTELQFLEDDNDVTVFTKDGTRLFYFGMNCADETLSNKTLRQAIACAIDKETIVQVVLSGMGKTQNTVVNRGMPTFYNEDDLGAYTYDVERAKELLAQAGYEPGELNLTLTTATDEPYKTLAPLIQAYLGAIGINVEINTMDQATVKSTCVAGEHQLFIWRWNAIDRLSEVFNELFCDGYTSNYFHYTTETCETLAREVETLMDADVRAEKSIELQKYLAEESPMVPLYVADLVIAYRNGLEGTYLFGGGNHVWTHAYIAN